MLGCRRYHCGWHADAPGVSSSGIQLQTSVQAMGEASAVAAGAYEEGEMNLWREREVIDA